MTIFRMDTMEKPAIRKLNKYLKKSDLDNFDEYCYKMRPAFPLMSPEDKEKALVDTLTIFPETVAYAMLKLSINEMDVQDFFRTEYKSSLEGFIENIEADILMAFGDVDLFLTYAKMYVIGMNGFTQEIRRKLSDRFLHMKCEREYNEAKNRPAYS